MFNDLKNSKYFQHVATTIYSHKLHHHGGDGKHNQILLPIPGIDLFVK